MAISSLHSSNLVSSLKFLRLILKIENFIIICQNTLIQFEKIKKKKKSGREKEKERGESIRDEWIEKEEKGSRVRKGLKEKERSVQACS